MWKVLDTGAQSAKKNMTIDIEFLNELKSDDSPTLHFYDFSEPSATYGYFLNPFHFLDLNKAKEGQNLSLARRPTGGGIVFHVTDLPFSVLMPANSPHFSSNTLDNYNFINNKVREAIVSFLKKTFKKDPFLLLHQPLSLNKCSDNFCMAKPTKYDVMIEGRKIAGAAQRRRKEGYLHQGTIAIALPPEDFLKNVLLPNTKVHEMMRQNTFSLLGPSWTFSELIEVRNTLKTALKFYLTKE